MESWWPYFWNVGGAYHRFENQDNYTPVQDDPLFISGVTLTRILTILGSCLIFFSYTLCGLLGMSTFIQSMRLTPFQVKTPCRGL